LINQIGRLVDSLCDHIRMMSLIRQSGAAALRTAVIIFVLTARKPGRYFSWMRESRSWSRTRLDDPGDLRQRDIHGSGSETFSRTSFLSDGYRRRRRGMTPQRSPPRSRSMHRINGIM
jgi:hypothetical protein